MRIPPTVNYKLRITDRNRQLGRLHQFSWDYITHRRQPTKGGGVSGKVSGFICVGVVHSEGSKVTVTYNYPFVRKQECVCAGNAIT